MQGVLVEVGGEQITTGDNGMALFEEVATGTNVPYTISKEGVSLSGTLNVSTDVSIERTLVFEDMDLFLALGQSNMAGRAPINDYVSDEIENVSLLNDGAAWVNASNPMNLYSNIRKDVDKQQVGPSYSFSKTLAKYVDKRIGMVVNARGGTNLTAFAGDTYYPYIAQRINESSLYGSIKGIIWHQGESNSSAADAYMGLLEPFVQDLRTEIGDDVYFLAGQLGPWNADGTDEPKYGPFNDTIVKIASYISNSDCVLSTNLDNIGDYTHFNVESQVLIGQRYAKKMLEKVYNIDISILELTLEGNGYINYADEVITDENDYSYTELTTATASLEIYAGQGKQFTQLLANGVEITDAVGDTVYTFNQSMASDNELSLQMLVEDVNTIGIDFVNLEASFFYPNPANQTITIANSSNEFDVSIFDNCGRRVLQSKNEKQIDIENLKTGAYIILLESEQKVQTQKLIIY
jgi:hypothetical protein